MKILDEWKKVCEAATEGPWEFERIAHDSGEFAYERNDDHALMVLREANYEKPMKAKFDAEFIALSRTALPVAIECLEMSEKALDDVIEYLELQLPYRKRSSVDHEDGVETLARLKECKKQIHARLESTK